MMFFKVLCQLKQRTQFAIITENLGTHPLRRLDKLKRVGGYLINWMISVDSCGFLLILVGTLQKATRKLRVVRLGLM